MRKREHSANAGIRVIPAQFYTELHKLERALKGGNYLSAVGYIQVRAYESNAILPLQDVSVAITDTSGSAIALRMTNRNGKLDDPVPIDVPEVVYSQSPNTGVTPFTTVNLLARLNNYEEIRIENLQIFANTVTVQDIEMIPLSEYPDSYLKSEVFPTPPQNL